MSEFMGLLVGEYDAKKGAGFAPGASSVHNRFTPHGPDAAALAAGAAVDTTRGARYEGTLAFMWECRSGGEARASLRATAACARAHRTRRAAAGRV